MTISDIKKTAKDNVSFQWGNLLLAFLLFTFLCTISNAVPGIGEAIAIGPLTIGFYHLYYQGSRKEPLNLWDIFKGFEECFGESLLMMLLTTLFVFLWGLLFIIPGIIKAYSYCMAPYLMVREKDLKGTDAIKKSMEYMKGEKWHFFVLQLSFIGWAILTLITFGLVGIYAIPYQKQAEMVFFNELYDRRKAEEVTRLYQQEFAAKQAENAAQNAVNVAPAPEAPFTAPTADAPVYGMAFAKDSPEAQNINNPVPEAPFAAPKTVIDAEYKAADIESGFEKTTENIDGTFVRNEDDAPKMDPIDPNAQ